MAVTDTQRYELREIIAALDRCRPRHDETGEATIARDAAALQIKAVARLTELAESDTASESVTRYRARPAVGERPC